MHRTGWGGQDGEGEVGGECMNGSFIYLFICHGVLVAYFIIPCLFPFMSHSIVGIYVLSSLFRLSVFPRYQHILPSNGCIVLLPVIKNSH